MNVLSLFEGMSCGRIALERAGIKADNYFASEIDKHAMQLSRANWNDITQIGSVTDIHYEVGTLITPNTAHKINIDLVIGGSPCQSFSSVGNGEGFDGKSGLFYEYLRVLREVKPTYFLLENVRMKKEWKDLITKELGVEPIDINSSLLSAQNRGRLYWTNIPDVVRPFDIKIYIKDVLMNTWDKALELKGKGLNKINSSRSRVVSIENSKFPCLLASQWKKPTDSVIIQQDGVYRYPTRTEMEKMQTVPQGYTEVASYNEASKMLGNGWTVDVISHIFSSLPQEYKKTL